MVPAAVAVATIIIVATMIIKRADSETIQPADCQKHNRHDGHLGSTIRHSLGKTNGTKSND